MSRFSQFITVFLLTWGGATLLVNSLNAKYFGLQNAMVAGLTERRTFALVDQVIPGFNLVSGDETFVYEGKVYPMKQPGQTIVGAAIYSVLRLAKIEWVHHYDYASSLITFLTSGLLIALAATAMYLVTKSYWTPMILVFGTIIWPYAGVSHHDIYATSVMAFATYLAYRNKHLAAGIVAGLTLFFSMLPLTLPLSLGLAIILDNRQARALTRYGLGVLLGLVPSLLFNYLSFGNPLLFPNLAGKVADTLPLWDLGNFVAHLQFYLTDYRSAFWAFSPILLFAWIGYRELTKRSKMLGYYMVTSSVLLLLHICTQETFGGYQYGPRYLLPLMPILATAASLAWGRLGRLGRLVFALAFVASFLVSLVGAMTTVMYPMPQTPFAPVELAQMILHGELPRYRMLPIGMLLLGLSLLSRRLKHINPVGGLDHKVARVMSRK